MSVDQAVIQTSADQDNLILRFLRLTLGNVLSNVTVPLATIFSTGFLGHLDEIHPLAGVALAGNLLSLLFLLLVSLRMGTTGLTAQAVGRDDREEMLLVGLRNIMLALGLGIGLIVLQYPLQQLGLAWVDAPPDVIASAIDYFEAYTLGAPAILINFVLLGWFLGREKVGEVILLTVIGSAANLAFDYLLIVQYDFASAGAGMSYAISQCLVLLVGFILVFQDVQWQELQTLTGKVWHLDALKATFTLNGNIFLNNLIFILAVVSFNYLGTRLGTTIYTENALLLEIVSLNAFLAEGVGFGVEALSGNAKGKGAFDQLAPLVRTAVITSLLMGMTLAGFTIIFPHTFFGLLTNHTEITELIDTYVWWLLPCLGFISLELVLEAYFLGLTEGETVRNVSLITFVVGFAPIAVAAWKFQDNHLLWLALSVFLIARTLGFGIQLPRTFKGSDIQTCDLASSGLQEIDHSPAN